jgi:peroxiredoxin (alkyl hydroperoxide reductase subunit C)
MKKFSLFIILLLSVTQLWAQEIKNTRIPVIGEQAPSFNASTTNGIINFPSDFGRKWKILFSHPADYTPVCSSEILELAYLQDDFEKLNVKLLVVSTDSLETHVQWKKALEGLSYKGRAPVKINIPLADDKKFLVSKQYGMIHAGSSSTKDVRGVFIIDPNNVVQAIIYYPMSVGRNMDEIKRTVIALQTVADGKFSTPANWQKGNDVILKVKPAAADLNKPENSGIYDVAWFMTFKKQ